MAPDQEYEIWAARNGYFTNTKQRLSLPEGETRELDLILRSPPPPMKAGEPVPGFLVKTIDNQVLSLDDLRGKFVLLSFWNPYNNECVELQDELRTIQTRSPR